MRKITCSIKQRLVKQFIFCFLFQVLAFNICTAQNADGSKSASTNVKGIEYPRIFPDNSVAFQVKAPEAQKVQIQLDKLYDLQRDEQGMWTVKTTP